MGLSLMLPRFLLQIVCVDDVELFLAAVIDFDDVGLRL